MTELDTIKHDMKEIKQNQELILRLLYPKDFSVKNVARITGRTRQAVREWVLKNGEPDVDFYKKGTILMLSEEVALKYINERR